MRTLLAAFLFAPLTACVVDPVATSPSNNPDLHVDLLFTHDGCTVYRFRDGGYHYYVRCDDAPPARVVSTMSCVGKGCQGESIQTVSR